jgi:hypothetical protein
MIVARSTSSRARKLLCFRDKTVTGSTNAGLAMQLNPSFSLKPSCNAASAKISCSFSKKPIGRSKVQTGLLNYWA